MKKRQMKLEKGNTLNGDFSMELEMWIESVGKELFRMFREAMSFHSISFSELLYTFQKQ